MRAWLYEKSYQIPGVVLVALLVAALIVKISLCLVFGRR